MDDHSDAILRVAQAGQVSNLTCRVLSGFGSVQLRAIFSVRGFVVPRHWRGNTTNGLPANFTQAKGRTLSAFAVFALCTGQRSLSGLGCAPLPPALVRGGLLQAAHIPGHGPIPAPAQCAG
jgi:hypothetical protein